MTQMTILKILGLDMITTSNFDTTTVEDALHEYFWLWIITDILTY